MDILYSDVPASILGAELDMLVYTAGESPLDYYKKYSDRCPIRISKTACPGRQQKRLPRARCRVIGFGLIVGGKTGD